MPPDAAPEPSPADGPVPRDLRGVGRRFGAWWSGPGMAEDPDGAFERAVLAWHPGYGYTVSRIAAELRTRVADRVDAARAVAVVDDPSALDTIAPARWRTGLRLLGFLGSATMIGTAVAGATFHVGGRRGADPVDTAIVTTIAAVVALVAHVAALLPPSRAGVPSRTTSFLLELATVAAAASALVLGIARDGWTGVAAGALVVLACSAIGLALVTVVVVVTRLRVPTPVRREHAEQEERIRRLARTVVEEELASASARMDAAWLALQPDTRAAIAHERRAAVDGLLARGIRVDAERLLGRTPGAALLPSVADHAWSQLDPQAAEQARRLTGALRGHFVHRAHLGEAASD